MKYRTVDMGEVLGVARDLIRDKWIQGEFVKWDECDRDAVVGVCSVGAMRYAFSQALELPYGAMNVVEHPQHRRAMMLLAQAFARMDTVWIRSNDYLRIRQAILSGRVDYSSLGDLIMHINDQGHDPLDETGESKEELHRAIEAAFDEAVEAAIAEEAQRRVDALEQELRALDVAPAEQQPEPVQV
jgi:HAMP domain-containing protein